MWRLCARVLLLDPSDRVLLVHARDPDEPAHHWWELPGGGIEPGEVPQDAALRELAEETGLVVLDEVGSHLWVRETCFRYRGRLHARRESVYLARIADTVPAVEATLTANEEIGQLGCRWWTQSELAASREKLLPPNLPSLLTQISAGVLRGPVFLHV